MVHHRSKLYFPLFLFCHAHNVHLFAQSVAPISSSVSSLEANYGSTNTSADTDYTLQQRLLADDFASTNSTSTDGLNITAIAIDRYEDNPCLALNKTRLDDKCVIDARKVVNWEYFPLQENEPCIRSTSLPNGGYAHIFINGTNLESETNNVRINVVHMESNASIPCEAISPYIPLSMNGGLRCAVTAKLPLGRLNINITVDDISVSSNMFNITPIAVCPCGKYPMNETTCLDCPFGGSCRGALDPSRALPGYWKTDPTEWRNDRYIDTAVYDVPPFVPCAYPNLCLGDQSCYPGSTGFMCAQCLPNYQRDRDGSCKECTSREYIGTITTLVLTPFALWIVYALYFIRDVNYRPTGIVNTSRIGTTRAHGNVVTTVSPSNIRHAASGLQANTIADIARATSINYPSLISLVQFGIMFCQVLGIFSLYMEPINHRTTMQARTDPRSSSVIFEFLSSFTIFSDFGNSSHALQCTFGQSYIQKLILVLVLPSFISMLIVNVYLLLYYGLVRSIYRFMFPRSRNDLDFFMIAHNNAKWTRVFVFYVVISPCILMLGYASSCALASDGGYLLYDPSVSCYDPDFRKIQSAATIFAYLHTSLVIFVIIMQIHAGRWHSAILRKARMNRIPLRAAYGNLTVYILSGKGALYVQNEIFRAQLVSPTLPSSLRVSFRDKWRAHIIDIFTLHLGPMTRKRGGVPYGWLYVILLRQIIFSGIATGIFGLQFPLTRIAATLFLLIVALVTNLCIQPYESRSLNILETLSLFGQITIAVAIAARLGFATQTLDEDPPGDPTGVTSSSRIRELLSFDIIAISFCAVVIIVWMFLFMDAVYFGRKWTHRLEVFLETLYPDNDNDIATGNHPIRPNSLIQLGTSTGPTNTPTTVTAFTTNQFGPTASTFVPNPTRPAQPVSTFSRLRRFHTGQLINRPPPPSVPRTGVPNGTPSRVPNGRSFSTTSVTVHRPPPPSSARSLSTTTATGPTGNGLILASSSGTNTNGIVNIIVTGDDDITDPPVLHLSSSSTNRRSVPDGDDDEPCTNPIIIVERRNHSHVRTLFTSGTDRPPIPRTDHNPFSG